MMRRLCSALLLGVLVQAAGAADLSFQADIAPILKLRCAACHLTGEEPGKMALHPRAAYQALVNAPSVESPLLRVKPGAPEESYLMHKLDGTHLDVGGSGLRMPMDGVALPAEDIERIRAWIKAGAPDD